MTFGQRVKVLRKRKGISQNALAELVGVSPRTIFGYEAGTTYPRTGKIREQLAEALGVESHDLIGDEEKAMASTRREIELSPAEQAEEATDRVIELLMGGTLTDREKDDVLKRVQKAYWNSKSKP